MFPSSLQITETLDRAYFIANNLKEVMNILRQEGTGFKYG